MTKLCQRKKLPSSNDGENILERTGLPSALYGAEVVDMKGEDRQIAKSREHCNEKNLESTKVGCTSSKKRRNRNKQHEVENSKEQ